MDRQKAMDIMSGRRSGPCASVVRVGLTLAAAPYSFAMRLRRRAYHRGLLNCRRADVPVISIGNITTGGTGKTPMVAWVVERLKEAGGKPAILIRGYKAVAGKGDEAELLRQLTDVPVIMNPDRVAGAAAAVAGGADAVVMDDGFQHLALRRDLDIVLIDATNPFGYGHCLPRGLLREPVSALTDADAVVITRSDEIETPQLGELRHRLGNLAPSASLHIAVHRPAGLIDQAGVELPSDSLRGRRVCALCGIGNPESFSRSLERLGADIVSMCVFDDHVAYTSAKINAIRNACRNGRAEMMVTTEKDYVKLEGVSLQAPLWRLAVVMDVVEGEQQLIDKIKNL